MVFSEAGGSSLPICNIIKANSLSLSEDVCREIKPLDYCHTSTKLTTSLLLHHEQQPRDEQVCSLNYARSCCSVSLNAFVIHIIIVIFFNLGCLVIMLSTRRFIYLRALQDVTKTFALRSHIAYSFWFFLIRATILKSVKFLFTKLLTAVECRHFTLY